MLNADQKRDLKAIANKLENKYQIGKNGVGKNSIMLIDKALEAHEIIKVYVLKTVDQEINELAFDLASNTHSDIVQIVGRAITLYRRSKKVGIKHVL